MTHLRPQDRLALLHGEASTTRLRALSDHLHRCPACTNAVYAERDVLRGVEAAGHTAERQPLRSRLLDAVLGRERFQPFGPALARLFDIDGERARALLYDALDGSTWPELLPAVRALHLEGGPSTAGADVGLVWLPAGGEFPHHHHTGEERVLILSGHSVDSAGFEAGPGDRADAPPGHDHSLRASADAPLLYAAVVWGFGIGPPPA